MPVQCGVHSRGNAHFLHRSEAAQTIVPHKFRGEMLVYRDKLGMLSSGIFVNKVHDSRLIEELQVC